MFPPTEFEWDNAKAASNLTKHGVPFAFAARVFLDAGVVDFDASRAPDGEARRKGDGSHRRSSLYGRPYATSRRG
jgi:uncharacterized DUF497 family protein